MKNIIDAIEKEKYFKRPIEHVDITTYNPRAFIDGWYQGIRGSGGDLAKAVKIYDEMLDDSDCTIFLTIAGSSSAQGMMNVWPQLVESKMVDVVVTTGANIIDMDLFEALGFKHYHGTPNVNNEILGDLGIDRIYDTFIDEDDLQEVDDFCRRFIHQLPIRDSYAPWRVLWELGKHLSEAPDLGKKKNSLLQTCYENGVPIFSIGLTDSAFGLGSSYQSLESCLGESQEFRLNTTPEYLDMAKIKLISPSTGLFMIGGGVPKNHAQDTIITAQGILEILRDHGEEKLLNRLGYGTITRRDEVPMHKYAIQVTVADPRDGACSSSTLEEARTWGKVDLSKQVMLFAEATLPIPILTSAAYHSRKWVERKQKRYADWLVSLSGPADFGEIPSSSAQYAKTP